MNIGRIKRSIDKCKTEIDRLSSRENLSIWGYWTLGYHIGRLGVLEDWLDDIQEEYECSMAE